MAEFYVVLNSRDSSNIYTNNTPTNFTNILPANIRLEDGWNVSLQSICVESKFKDKVPKSVKNADIHVIYRNSITRAPIASFSLPTNLVYDRATLYNEFLTQFAKTFAGVGKGNLDMVRKGMGMLIAVKNNELLILRGLCEWLDIDVDGRHQVIPRGTDNVYYVIPGENRGGILLGVTINPNVHLPFPIIAPTLLKVQLEEMRPSLSHAKTRKDLTIIPFQSEQKSFFYHEAKQKEYFPLLSDRIEKLSLRLIDEDNEELDLLTLQPAVIKLKFKKMNGLTFVVRVTSQDSVDLHTENNSNHFRIQLPHPIVLSGGSWQVALLSAIYPKNISISDQLSRQDLWMIITPLPIIVNRDFRIRLNGREIQDIQSLRTHLQRLLLAEVDIPENSLQFIVNENNDRQIGYHSKAQYRIQFSPHLAHLFGINQSFLRGPVDGPRLATIETRPMKDNVHPNWFGILDFGKCLPSGLWLYADFIEPVIVGSKFSKLLKFIPVIPPLTKPIDILQHEDESTYQSYESAHLDYIDVSSVELQSLQSMEFKLRDHDGNPVLFDVYDNFNNTTYVNLIFRKKI